jgi:hypothetical protein
VRSPLAPRFRARLAHFMSIWDGRGNGISLSAPGSGDGRGEVGDSRKFAEAHLTLPSLSDGPLPLPPEGRRGFLTGRARRVHALALSRGDGKVLGGRFISGQILNPSGDRFLRNRA